jgi:hypothetical protein
MDLEDSTITKQQYLQQKRTNGPVDKMFLELKGNTNDGAGINKHNNNRDDNEDAKHCPSSGCLAIALQM